VKAIVAKYNLKVIRIHTHIGSGSDPVVWQSVTGLSLGLVEEFPDAVALNLGGGYKVGRMSYEASTDLLKVGAPVKKEFEDFAARTGRKLKLEIEPGTFLVANAGTLLCSVQVLSYTHHTCYFLLSTSECAPTSLVCSVQALTKLLFMNFC
jgi:diaminopimelate decarboxylase